MNKPHKHAELIKAWADGAEIECRSPYTNYKWGSTTAPLWLPSYEYRVKPQPKKYKVHVWLVFDKRGKLLSQLLCQPPEYNHEGYRFIPHTLEGELPNE